jgi:GTP-binding protein
MTLPFHDEAEIEIFAGNGGDGVVSFRREAHVALGGPDGGDGGKGGDIYIVADHNVASLAKFRSQKKFKAEHGKPGEGRQCTGRGGQDLEILVPVGTLVRNTAHEQLADLSEHGARFLAAVGGKGGLGNQHFKSSTNRTPRKATLGKPGEEAELFLELALVGDVGLVGFPNAGKSTFLSVVTNAKPKIADYPFTTLTPNQGICDLDIERSLLIADIPGLIEGAAEGIGLGHQFLKHIQRTSVLLFLLDSTEDVQTCVKKYETLCKELADFDEGLMQKSRIVALSKVDSLSEADRATKQNEIETELKQPVVCISSTAHIGIRELLENLWSIHTQTRTREKQETRTEVLWSPLETE